MVEVVPHSDAPETITLHGCVSACSMKIMLNRNQDFGEGPSMAECRRQIAQTFKDVRVINNLKNKLKSEIRSSIQLLAHTSKPLILNYMLYYPTLPHPGLAFSTLNDSPFSFGVQEGGMVRSNSRALSQQMKFYKFGWP